MDFARQSILYLVLVALFFVLHRVVLVCGHGRLISPLTTRHLLSELDCFFERLHFMRIRLIKAHLLIAVCRLSFLSEWLRFGCLTADTLPERLHLFILA